MWKRRKNNDHTSINHFKGPLCNSPIYLFLETRTPHHGRLFPVHKRIIKLLSAGFLTCKLVLSITSSDDERLSKVSLMGEERHAGRLVLLMATGDDMKGPVSGETHTKENRKCRKSRKKAIVKKSKLEMKSKVEGWKSDK